MNGKGISCRTCFYWNCRNELRDHPYLELQCRRRSPNFSETILSREGSGYKVFPITSTDDWCGEWEHHEDLERSAK